MKRQKNLLMLSLLALLLGGCGQKASDTPSVSDSQVSEIGEISQVTASKPSEEPSTGKTSDEGKSNSSGTDSDSVSTSVSTSSQTLWNKDTANLMRLYFDGYCIPYVNLGKNYDAEWIDSTSKTSTYLSIIGEEFDATKRASFRQTYEDDGWKVTKSLPTSLVAEKGAFKVDISKDSDGYFHLKAYYDVVYDATKAPADWDTDTASEIAADFNNLSIPYIYLGSPVCYTRYVSSTQTLTIYGYKFDASILTSAKTTFENAKGWTVAESSNSKGPTLTATYVSDGGDVLTATLLTQSSSATFRYSMTVKMSENWDKDSVTKWPSSREQDFSSNCDGHIPTFFYLGTKSPTSTYADSSHQFKITGGVYDARTIPLVKQTLSDAGWTVKDTTGQYGAALSAYIDLNDGARFKLFLQTPQTTTSKIVAQLFYYPKLDIPDTCTDWDDATKNVRKAQLGQTLPYIYLGSDNLTTSYTNANAKMIISTSSTGTFFTQNIVINAEKVLKADNWKVTRSDNTSYGDNLYAEKTFDNGDKRSISLSSVSATFKGSLYIQRYEAYDGNYEGTWYSDRSSTNLTGTDTSSTGQSMDKNFEGHKIPYIYLGTKRHNSSFDPTTHCRTIYGGQWNTAIIGNAKATFEKDNESKGEGDSDWSVTTDSDSSLSLATSLTAKKSFADGTGFEVYIKKPTSGSTSNPVNVTTMKIYYKDSWGSTATDWTDTIKKKMTSVGFPSGDLVPYVYLGTDNPTLGLSGSGAYQHYVKIKGAVFDDRVLNEFDTARTNGGWTVDKTPKTRYGKDSHEAYKYVTDDQGQVTGVLRSAILRSSNSDTAVAELAVFYDSYADASTATATPWSDAQKTVRKENLGGSDEAVLPEINRGSKVDVKYMTNNGGYVDIKTNGSFAYNFFNRKKANDTLAAAGWTTQLAIFSNTAGEPNYLSKIAASKTISSGKLMLTVTGSTTSREIKVYYYEKYTAPATANAKWDTETSTGLSASMDGYVLPYFYIGSASPKYTSSKVTSTSNKVATLVGSTWDSKIITDRKAALKADKTVTDWSFYDDYSAGAKYGVVTRAGGTYSVTTPAVYGEDGTTIITPETTIVHHITIKLYKDTEANANRPIVEVYYF